MTEQPDLFEWADSRPTGVVIDARRRFDIRTEAYIYDLIAGRHPPRVETKIIRPEFRTLPERGAA